MSFASPVALASKDTKEVWPEIRARVPKVTCKMVHRRAKTTPRGWRPSFLNELPGVHRRR